MERAPMGGDLEKGREEGTDAARVTTAGPPSHR